MRRPLPSDEPSAAKRLLLLLLAVVGAQIYNAPGDAADGASGAPLGAATPLGTPRVPPIPEGPQIPAGNAATPNGTASMAPMGVACFVAPWWQQDALRDLLA